VERSDLLIIISLEVRLTRIYLAQEYITQKNTFENETSKKAATDIPCIRAIRGRTDAVLDKHLVRILSKASMEIQPVEAQVSSTSHLPQILSTESVTAERDMEALECELLFWLSL